mmetsp:Transcript_14680/g.21660  ORF Transcript_14680/g.21660 Transcript_14680/m.21660 type:complete len:85 (+) Transcript_14680:1-255(+)
MITTSTVFLRFEIPGVSPGKRIAYIYIWHLKNLSVEQANDIFREGARRKESLQKMRTHVFVPNYNRHFLPKIIRLTLGRALATD